MGSRVHVLRLKGLRVDVLKLGVQVLGVKRLRACKDLASLKSGFIGVRRDMYKASLSIHRDLWGCQVPESQDDRV